MSTTTTTDWRKLALELAATADELAKAARAVQRGWDVAPLAGGMLHVNAQRVEHVLKRVKEAAQ